jgi:hypothetical protein
MRSHFPQIRRTALEALLFGEGWTCCPVRLWGEVVDENGGLVATDVEVMAIADARQVCIQFACDCAQDALTIERKRGNVPDASSWIAIDAARSERNEAEINDARRAFTAACSASASREAVGKAERAISAARSILDAVEWSSDYDHPDFPRTDLPDITKQVDALMAAAEAHAAASATESAELAACEAVDAAVWATENPRIAAFSAAWAAYLAARVAGFAACAEYRSRPDDSTDTSSAARAAAQKAYAMSSEEHHRWIYAFYGATADGIDAARQCYNGKLEQKLSSLFGAPSAC